MNSCSWPSATGAQIASSVADAGVAVRNQPTPNYAVNAAVRLARSRGGERAWRVSGSGAPFTIRGSVDDELITAVLAQAAAALTLAADHVAARRDAAGAVLWVHEIGDAGGGERAKREAGRVADAGCPSAGAGICDQGVRVPGSRRAEHVDPRAGNVAPVRAARGGDVGQEIERDDDQVALCLRSVDDRDGHLPLKVAEDVEAGACREVTEGKSHGYRCLTCVSLGVAGDWRGCSGARLEGGGPGWGVGRARRRRATQGGRPRACT